MQGDFAPNAGQVPAIIVVAPQTTHVQDDPTQPAELCRRFRHGPSRAPGMGLFQPHGIALEAIERDGGMPSRSSFVAGWTDCHAGRWSVSGNAR